MSEIPTETPFPEEEIVEMREIRIHVEGRSDDDDDEKPEQDEEDEDEKMETDWRMAKKPPIPPSPSNPNVEAALRAKRIVKQKKEMEKQSGSKVFENYQQTIATKTVGKESSNNNNNKDNSNDVKTRSVHRSPNLARKNYFIKRRSFNENMSEFMSTAMSRRDSAPSLNKDAAVLTDEDEDAPGAGAGAGGRFVRNSKAYSTWNPGYQRQASISAEDDDEAAKQGKRDQVKRRFKKVGKFFVGSSK